MLDTKRYEAQLPCCAVNSCPLVNDCNLLAGFSDCYLHLSLLTASMKGNPSSYRVHIWSGKTRMAGLQSGEGRMMIDSVVWAQHINVTDTQTHRQPRRHSNSRHVRPAIKWKLHYIILHSNFSKSLFTENTVTSITVLMMMNKR